MVNTPNEFDIITSYPHTPMTPYNNNYNNSYSSNNNNNSPNNLQHTFETTINNSKQPVEYDRYGKYIGSDLDRYDDEVLNARSSSLEKKSTASLGVISYKRRHMHMSDSDEDEDEKLTSIYRQYNKKKGKEDEKDNKEDGKENKQKEVEIEDDNNDDDDDYDYGSKGKMKMNKSKGRNKSKNKSNNKNSDDDIGNESMKGSEVITEDNEGSTTAAADNRKINRKVNEVKYKNMVRRGIFQEFEDNSDDD